MQPAEEWVAAGSRAAAAAAAEEWVASGSRAAAAAAAEVPRIAAEVPSRCRGLAVKAVVLQRHMTGWCQQECCTEEDDPLALPQSTYTFGTSNVFDEVAVLPSLKDDGKTPVLTTDVGSLAHDERNLESIKSMTLDELAVSVADSEGNNEVATSDEAEQSCSLQSRPVRDVGSGFTYVGQWKGKVRHGQGVLKGFAGQIYFGEFLNNHAHGTGVLKEANGTTYKGQWEASRRHGRGKLIQADGLTYEGEWEEGLQSGEGLETRPDGSCYQGQFCGNYRNGTGTLVCSNFTYTGQFRNGEMHGAGLQVCVDGRSYQGQWHDGSWHGLGRMDWPNGSSYNGEFAHGHKHGQGRFIYPDGRWYQGRWDQDKLSSDGIMRGAEAADTLVYKRTSLLV